MRTIQKVAVLGAGTMGARIAAHFANAGIPSVLLDIVLPNQPIRNAAALKGIDNAAKQRPGGFFVPEAASLITPGNFEDDLAKVSDCDWIIEAVAENLTIKRDLWKKVELLRKPTAIVSTNTSGIPLHQIAEGFSTGFRSHFLGTHFFNPPRYMHLVELIPLLDTSGEVMEFVSAFCDRRLGKGVVPCKDTPNFIANRIGSFFGATVQKIAIEGDYTVEEVDLITGPLIGLPNSGSFRLLDIVGLDVWANVGTNLYHAVPDDSWRDRFLMPEFHTKMTERGWLGEKSGQGFYKRVGKDKEIHAIDLHTFEYHPAIKVKFPTAEAARNIEDLPERLRVLVAGNDRVGTFLWKLYSDLFLYSAERVPEIADEIFQIDRAMRWGYANKLGPFELWDALGFKYVCDRLQSDGRNLPENVQNMVSQGAASLYLWSIKGKQAHKEYYDFISAGYKPLLERPSLSDVKRAGNEIKSNAGASLIDLGEGVICCEFHSKMNSLGEDQIGMIYNGLKELEENFDAMVISNQGENFSVGANLMLVLLAAQEGEWEDLNAAIHRFQQATMALKYAPKPVVAAPFSRALGGGCEIPIHCSRIQASAETYIGLVEVGVGLIPGAGGTKEMTIRLQDARKTFELIAMAKVSSSAEEARQLGYLNKTDRISMNPNRLIDDAKELALSLVKDYQPGTPRADVKVGGESAFALMKLGAWTMRQGGYISDYDVIVAEKLAHVISGGRLTGEQLVSEQYLLDLEREAFLSLCGNPKTQERMQYMLKTGKPLRN
ncbi:MAG TPA: 3-hydroxyacyl-CoA dehydrogenase/enoyl-CoA hydratase family protein [Bryobacteraceae bacterium]|jgi:3-hydroxyacyl-CoA dehydrogenase|nr:3-hydroxyacyl-CoA dehydrogenase/enoyl-CoA hydratase family protein [Bryobacteraceae bacterium]